MYVWIPQALYIHEPKLQIQNSVDTDQIAPHGATKSGSTLFSFASSGKWTSSCSTYVRAYLKTLGPTKGKERKFTQDFLILKTRHTTSNYHLLQCTCLYASKSVFSVLHVHLYFFDDISKHMISNLTTYTCVMASTVVSAVSLFIRQHFVTIHLQQASIPPSKCSSLLGLPQSSSGFKTQHWLDINSSINQSLHFTSYLKETDNQPNIIWRQKLLEHFKPFLQYIYKLYIQTIFEQLWGWVGGWVGWWVNAHKPNIISHLVCLALNDHTTS